MNDFTGKLSKFDEINLSELETINGGNFLQKLWEGIKGGLFAGEPTGIASLPEAVIGAGQGAITIKQHNNEIQETMDLTGFWD